MKKEFRWFTIFEYEKEQDYLREQHKGGWKLEKVTGLGMYHFSECTPEDVVYQLDYNQEGSAHREEYTRMFADCGWEYILEYAGYSYFRKPASDMDGEEEIFCDDSSKLAMMDRVYKGRLVPLLVLFFCCLMPQFFLNMSNGNYFVAAFLGGILGLYVVVFIGFAIQYYRRKNRR
jgi:hypothetical protein